MKGFRLLPATLIAIALMATPVQAVVHHGAGGRVHRGHAAHRHAAVHAQSHAPTVARAGGAIGATLGSSLHARNHIAHAASDPTVTIADFQFTPASITIHVGDTVTWVNNGPSAHTATANNGSFNTGVLQKGQSASHTFTTAGTFTYICSIHPFMHGTIVVLANTSSTTPTTTSTTPTTTSTTPTSTTTAANTGTTASTTQTSGQTLPMTGFALTATVLAGFLLTGVGLAIRRKLRS